MKTIIALSLFLFILGGCKTSSTFPPSRPQLPSIFGTWKLVQISGGFSGHGMPLTSQEQTITFINNGTFICSASDLLKVSDGTFTLSQRFSNLLNRNCSILRLNNNNIGSIINIYEINGDTLTLSSEINDCLWYVFKRK